MKPNRAKLKTNPKRELIIVLAPGGGPTALRGVSTRSAVQIRSANRPARCLTTVKSQFWNDTQNEHGKCNYFFSFTVLVLGVVSEMSDNSGHTLLYTSDVGV